MTYLIISDTHHFTNNAISLIENLKPDYCIHLGDMVRDCEDLESIFPRQKFIFVKGNNDYFNRNVNFPDERIFELEGRKFFICHGHKYNVKYGLELLISTAKKHSADIILYGHTHQKYLSRKNGMTIMNPGTFCSYGIIKINANDINAELYDYDRKKFE